MAEEVDALVIGAGPAGLMAAEVLAQAGHRVLIAEAKPSPGRKFLMAGKSGLNLTKAEPDDVFRADVSTFRWIRKGGPAGRCEDDAGALWRRCCALRA